MADLTSVLQWSLAKWSSALLLRSNLCWRRSRRFFDSHSHGEFAWSCSLFLQLATPLRQPSGDFSFGQFSFF
jgi:hypothetical protein